MISFLNIWHDSAFVYYKRLWNVTTFSVLVTALEIQMCKNIHVCVGTYVYMCVEANTYVCITCGYTCVKAKWQPACHSLVTSALLFDTVSHEPRAHWCSHVVGQAPAICFRPSSDELDSLNTGPHTWLFSVGAGDWTHVQMLVWMVLDQHSHLAGSDLQFLALFWGFTVFSSLWKQKMTVLVIILTVDKL